jgi:transcriptional antiterminator RfaH
VRWGDTVPALPAPVINCLLENVDEVGCIPTLPADYKPGDKLLIKSGPFAGYEGLFYARRSEDRVLLLLEVMGQQQKVLFEEASVERVSAR